MAYTSGQRLLDNYTARKERYELDGIPFISYLHTGGWLFMRLDTVELVPWGEGSEDVRNLKHRAKHSSIRLTSQGRRDFDRIVNGLRKSGKLLDVTYHLLEGDKHGKTVRV